MFADDTKVGQDVSDPGGRQDLQEMLDRLWRWVSEWGMAFNVEKCHVVHFGRKNPHHKYSMNGKELVESEYEKDV